MVEKSKKDKDKEEKKKLKKKLKELSKKYLQGRKKRTKDPKKFKQIQQDINRKVDTAQSMTDINRLMSLLQKPLPRTTAEIGTIGQRLSKAVEQDLKSSSVVENYNNFKAKLSNAKDKYNNETLSWEDIDNIYKSGKSFGQSIQTDIQTLGGLKTVYDATSAGAKKAYDYLTRLLNRNRPSGTNAFNPSGEQAPPPPPPTQTPPPPPTTQAPPPPPTEEPRVVQPPREDTESYLRRGLNVITNPVLGAGLLGLGANYLMGRQRIRQLREQGNRREEDTQTETVEPTQQLAEAQSLLSNSRRNRQAYNSFRDRTQERQLRQDTGLQTKVSEELRGFRDSDIDIKLSRETMDRIIGNTEQSRLEDRMDRLRRSRSENERIDAEQRQYEEEEGQRQMESLREYQRQQQQEPQME